jgi:Cu(I)/Ag(I) efflux system membrane fusion protein
MMSGHAFTRSAGQPRPDGQGRPKGLHYSALLTLTLAAAACAPAPATDNTPKAGAEMSRAVIDPYLKIQAALADDSMDEVKANAGSIATAATALGAPAVKIDTAAIQLASATEISDARDKFGVLSEAIDKYMTGLHLVAPEGVKVAMCPMVQKPWLQADATLHNPYFGKSMQTCGSFR